MYKNAKKIVIVGGIFFAETTDFCGKLFISRPASWPHNHEIGSALVIQLLKFVDRYLWNFWKECAWCKEHHLEFEMIRSWTTIKIYIPYFMLSLPRLIDWLIEQELTSHQTHYRSYWGRFLRVKWPNQQCQSTEGSSGPKDRLQSH